MPLMAVISIAGGNSGIVRYIQFRINDAISIRLTLGEYSEEGTIRASILNAMAEPPYYIVDMVTLANGASGVANILL